MTVTHSPEMRDGVFRSSLLAQSNDSQKLTYRDVDPEGPYQVSCALLNFVGGGTQVSRDASGTTRLDTLRVNCFDREHMIRIRPTVFDDKSVKEGLKHGVYRILPTADIGTTVSV